MKFYIIDYVFMAWGLLITGYMVFELMSTSGYKPFKSFSALVKSTSKKIWNKLGDE